MESKLVTIIIPVYNEEKYIERCISSVVNQTYKNIEIIVVDDGSKDRSREIISKLAKQDKRIIVRHKENGGLSSARNTALEIFTGDYVYFLDSDDYLYPTSIEFLLSIMLEKKVDIVYSFTNPDKRNKMVTQSDIEIKNKEESIESYLNGENFSESCCAKLFKKSIFDDLRFDDGKIFEDAFITYKILDKIDSIAITKFNGYISTNRENSITHSKYSDKNYDGVEANRNIFNFYKNTKYMDKAFNKYVGSLLFFILKTNKTNGLKNNNIAKKELREVLKKFGVNKLKPKLLALVILFKLGILDFLYLK